MRPQGPDLEAGDERMLHARYRAVLDAGHSRNCALAFARAYLSDYVMELRQFCLCGRQPRRRFRYRRAA